MEIVSSPVAPVLLITSEPSLRSSLCAIIGLERQVKVRFRIGIGVGVQVQVRIGLRVRVG